jgi:hypothetical protein
MVLVFQTRLLSIDYMDAEMDNFSPHGRFGMADRLKVRWDSVYNHPDG